MGRPTTFRARTKKEKAVNYLKLTCAFALTLSLTLLSQHIILMLYP